MARSNIMKKQTQTTIVILLEVLNVQRDLLAALGGSIQQFVKSPFPAGRLVN